LIGVWVDWPWASLLQSFWHGLAFTDHQKFDSRSMDYFGGEEMLQDKKYQNYTAYKKQNAVHWLG
jgi:hypothetical protein